MSAGSHIKIIEYETDGHDRRIAKKINGSYTARYIWIDQLRLGAELNPDGTMRKQFVYADGINSPEYMIYQGKRFLFVKDHRGSILKVVDTITGETKQQLAYSEFGEVLMDTNPGFQPFGFAGGLYDYDTKLVRFGARDYDGRVGRWLSKDPIRFEGGDTNLYGYVLNDPVNFVDPEGTIGIWTVVKTVVKWACRGLGCSKGGGDKLNEKEGKEVDEMYNEAKRKRQKEDEGCGVIKSCTPKPKLPEEKCGANQSCEKKPVTCPPA